MEFGVETRDSGRAAFRWKNLGGGFGDAFLLRIPGCNVLFDVGFAWYGRQLAADTYAELNGEPLHRVLLSHSHYDHAAGVPYVKERFPGTVVTAAVHAAEVFQRESARRGIRELDDHVARAYGHPIADGVFESIRADESVSDGDELLLGTRRAQVLEFPGHTRDSLGFYFPEEKLLLSCETLGVPKAGGHVALAMLIGYAETVASIQRALTLDIESMLLPHSGMLFGKENCRALLEGALRSAERLKDATLRMAGEGLGSEEAAVRLTRLIWGNAPEKTGGDKALLLNSRISYRTICREFGLTE